MGGVLAKTRRDESDEMNGVGGEVFIQSLQMFDFSPKNTDLDHLRASPQLSKGTCFMASDWSRDTDTGL